MSKRRRYFSEFSERAVRMVVEHEKDHDSQWAAIRSVSEKTGRTAETLHRWVRRANVRRARAFVTKGDLRLTTRPAVSIVDRYHDGHLLAHAPRGPG